MFWKFDGGGYNGSSPILNALSAIDGINLDNNGEDNSRQGFVFT